jgi:archaellum component FlaF (FlaF/FlaG flagellin family)
MSGTGSAVAVAILLIGLLAGLMLAQPSFDRALDDLKGARESVVEEMTNLQNTGISITSVIHNSTTSVLNLTVENDGSIVITMSDVDILLNGTYISTGMTSLDYFYPGQDLTFSLTNITDPRSIKVVGPWGISDTTTMIVRG